MRGYILCEVRNRRVYGRLSALFRWLNNRRTRNGLKLLQNMDDHALWDIGLTRDSLENLLAMPNAVDLRWEAERLRAVWW
jgi:uncharacterized protein YjiS (DUF1127 family)